MGKTINVVSVSGGKDSTATLLLALERGVENLQAVFADTGHEHPEVYKYLDYLESKLGITIRRIKPDFSLEIMHKRDVVKTKWARDIPLALMADKPGRWELKSNYAKVKREVISEVEGDLGYDEERVPISSELEDKLLCPDGVEIDYPELPTIPEDRYSASENGPFRWKPAIRGMSEAEAMDRTETIIKQALSVLHPTGNPFLDLCLWKGRFPSRMARFCTEELKRNPMLEQVLVPLLEDPDTDEVFNWQGVRADESPSRAKLHEQDEVGDGLFNYRPILNWTAQDVFDFHRKHGVKWNPLYEQGLTRVGCMPCVMCRKDELQEIVNRFPAEIERVAEWERIVGMASKQGASAFYGPRVMGGGGSIEGMDAEQAMSELGIHRVAEWSKTSRGGHMFDMFAALGPDVGCSSAYGLCDSPVVDNGQVIIQTKA